MKILFRGAILAVLLGLGTAAVTPHALAAHAGKSSVKVKVGSVSGVGKVLTNAKGFTLYYLKQEKDGTIHCARDCTSIWLPLLGSKPKHVQGAKGKFGTTKRPEGTTQITYNGWPLYTYAGDSRKGTASGNGITDSAGSWFAAKVSLKKR